MKLVFAIVFAALFIIMTGSCSKEYSVEKIQDSSATRVVDTTYQPLESGSYWVYQDSATGVYDTLRATDSTLSINSKIYTVFQSTTQGGTTDEYFTINAHNYYCYDSFPSGLGTVELLYLNDTASPGYTWQVSAGTINGYPAQVQGQIIDTGLMMTVGANTFTQVIHSEISIAYNVGSGFQTPYAIFNYYIAKGVGIIKLEEDYPTLSTTQVSNLVSYVVQ